MTDYIEGQKCIWCGATITKEFIDDNRRHYNMLAHCFYQLFGEMTKGDPEIEAD